MHIGISLIIGFVIASLLATFMASEMGERVKQGWASLWCPDAPKMPVVDLSKSPDDPGFYTPPTCQDRVLDATGTMISIGLSIATVYALVWTWVSLTSGGNNKRGYNNYSSNLVMGLF